MRNEIVAVLCLAGLLAGAPVRAGSAADDLTRIETEAALTKARLKLLDMQAQVAAKQAEIDRAAPPASSVMPMLAGVDGVGSRLYASVVMENGSIVEARQGDRLPNGMRVVAVASDGVTIATTGNRRVRLQPAPETAPAAPAYSTTLVSPGGGFQSTPTLPPLTASRPVRSGDQP